MSFLKNLNFRFRDEHGLSKRILTIVIKAWKKLVIAIEDLDILNLNRILIREGNGPHSSTLAWKIPWTEEPGRLAVHGVVKSRTRLSDFTLTFHIYALEKEMATHSSVLAWRIPGMREPGGLPSMGSHRVGHDWSNLAAAAAAGF